jgi:hypothetical protein
MLSQESVEALKLQVGRLLEDERSSLEELRKHAATLRAEVRRIQPRPATSMSLVATDGGNNKVQYDPLLVNLVRVVDSSSNEYHLEAVTPNLSLQELDARQFNSSGVPQTALGRMMRYMYAKSLADICQVFGEKDELRSASWIGEYRGLHEWAVLFHIVREKDFATDTIVVRDGPFREKMFKPGIFKKFRDGLVEGLEDQLKKKRRRLYLAGVLKKSKLFQKYRLALALEGTFHTRYASFAEIPKEMMRTAFKWSEWIENSGSDEGFVAGKLFAAKFGDGPYDPVWLVDLFDSQAHEAARVLSYLLNDAVGGFPVPCYPASLQRAHDAAALVDFDMDILERLIGNAFRDSLGDRAEVVDKLAIQESDPSAARY